MIDERGETLEIGSLKLANRLLLAPLSGISDLPFRLLAKEQGCALVCTEMVSAEGLVRNRQKSGSLLRSCREERPLAVQIFGSRPEAMEESARIVADLGADLLDINMGCPVRKVVHGGSGAALLKDLPRAEKILRAVRKAVALPLTIKIRSGWDEKNPNYLEMALLAQDCGVDSLTLHGRSRAQGYGIKADWGVITRTRRALRIPVIGNGDLTSPQTVADLFAGTGCAGAMIGRGALGNPWIFRQSLQLLQGGPVEEPSLQEKEETILRHLQAMVEIRGETRALREFRKHLIWYTRGMGGSAGFRQQIPSWTTVSEMADQIRKYLAKPETA